MASTKSAPKKKAAPKVPSPFDDLNTAEDEQAVPGHFVEAVSGPHEGRYGVLVEQAGPSTVIVRTRDADNELINVAYGDLRPAESGRR